MKNNDELTILDDGSACVTGSFPLPHNHWIYEERKSKDDYIDSYIIKEHYDQIREKIKSAAKEAVKGATYCGKDMDFDPDALIMNLMNNLFGVAYECTTTPTGESPFEHISFW